MAGPPVASMGPCGAHHASDVIVSSRFLPFYLIKVFYLIKDWEGLVVK